MSDDTVARHGLRYRFNGIPWWDYDRETWVVRVPEPMWAEGELTPEQVAEVDALVAETPAKLRDDDPMWVRWAVMRHEGIEHTHRRGKPIIPERPGYGYECLMCRSMIVAKDPGDFPFRGGPADGRWIVTGGVQRFRVPIPQLAMVVSDDSFPDVRMPVAEYELRRGAYYLIG